MSDLITERGKLGSAVFSPCRKYRYLLTRGADDAPRRVAFCMLNPSTADHDKDDRTIAKCRKFAARFALERGWFPEHRDLADLPLAVDIVNLYAIRATKPRDCFGDPTPVGGILNDLVIRERMAAADLAIAAWGADSKSAGRSRTVLSILRLAGVELHRLGPASKDRSPQHPLYLRGDLPLEVHR